MAAAPSPSLSLLAGPHHWAGPPAMTPPTFSPCRWAPPPRASPHASHPRLLLTSLVPHRATRARIPLFPPPPRGHSWTGPPVHSLSSLTCRRPLRGAERPPLLLLPCRKPSSLLAHHCLSTSPPSSSMPSFGHSRHFLRGNSSRRHGRPAVSSIPRSPRFQFPCASPSPSSSPCCRTCIWAPKIAGASPRRRTPRYDPLRPLTVAPPQW
jgi:hypothetical protein